MRRTGKESLHERVIKMDLKDLVNELETAESQTFVCEGGYLRCPKCTCEEVDESETDRDERLKTQGFEPVSDEQRELNFIAHELYK